MRRKALALSAIALAAAGLCSCNQNIGLGNYSFTKVHITTSERDRCVEISSWHNNDVGIEVKTKDYGSLYLSEGTYILIESKCPICDA